jgi:preprotein translocase subunit YajC
MAAQQANPLMSLAPIVVMVVIFYLLLFLPMRRKQKKHQELLNQLTRGDRVITTGGIFGTVVSVDGEIIELRVADNVKIQIARNAVAGLAKDAGSVNLGPKE